MADYKLTVVNDSEILNEAPTFVVLADADAAQPGGGLSIAWLAQRIHRGNRYTFSWDMSWGFAWSTGKVTEGSQWTPDGHLPADPGSPSMNAAKFDYQQGDFLLTHSSHALSPEHDMLWVQDGGEIPTPGVKPSSIGITLGGHPMCVVGAGPNLEQNFTLHPTYYIAVGDVAQGQVINGSELMLTQRIEFVEGVTDLTALLDTQNQWHITTGDFAASPRSR